MYRFELGMGSAADFGRPTMRQMNSPKGFGLSRQRVQLLLINANTRQRPAFDRDDEPDELDDCGFPVG